MTRIRAEEAGLRFFGDYASDKDKIVEKRDEYRKAGIKCTIVVETFTGKIKAAAKTGYSLFAEKELV